MNKSGWIIVLLAAALTGCGGSAPAPEAQPSKAAELPESTAPAQRILAFGDSLFAGYNLPRGQGYPERLEAGLRQRGTSVKVVNAGVSGDTTAAGLQRIDFVLASSDDLPDLAIVELGGNDLLRGLPPAETYENLSGILAKLQERKIPVLLMGMRAPPNLGEDYVAEFDAIYPKLAERYGAQLVPFFLEAVYDKPQLIQADRVHPTAEGIEALVQATVGEVAEALPDAE